jgi:mannan endo-1,4-beta-mannosidase
MGSFALIGLMVACVVAGVRAAKHKDFVYAEGTELKINDRSFYYAGSNTYYLFYAQPQDIDSLFAAANSIDAKVIRTWLWADGLTDGVSYAGETVYYQNYNTTTKKMEYNDNSLTGLGRMDYIIESAKKHGVKLILTLTNNWSAFGGMDWYVQTFNGTYHDQFYTEPVIKQWYKDWVSHALHRVNAISGVRYIDEPTIMLWEIGNEPRCVGSGEFPASPSCNTKTITKWIKEMSAHVKSIDHKHLVAIGDEGFFANGPVFPGAYSNIYDGSAGMDFDANLQIDTIDVVSFTIRMTS